MEEKKTAKGKEQSTRFTLASTWTAPHSQRQAQQMADVSKAELEKGAQQRGAHFRQSILDSRCKSGIGARTMQPRAGGKYQIWTARF